MKNRYLLLGYLTCLSIHLCASIKPSIYDPIGKLSPTELNRIESEGTDLITNRKINGMDLVIQIDFMSPTGENKFDEGGVSKGNQIGKSIFSLGTYAKWSLDYFSEPAVLMLFLDQGDGIYELDALKFSDMLMDEGIPDLVRRYIRDEIMRKESNYVEMISSGLYAIGKALDPTYKERLVSMHTSLFIDNQYKRRHAWPKAIPMNYYSFEPFHNISDNNELVPDLLSFVGNNIYLDWSSISYSGTEIINISEFHSETDKPWYDKYLLKYVETPMLMEIIDHPDTHQDNVTYITNTFKEDLIALLNDPFHYGNQDISTHDASLLPLAFYGENTDQVTQEYRLDRFGCRIKVLKKVMDEPWQYIPDVINRAVYSKWSDKGPTWCNQYCIDLSKQIFKAPIFTSSTANELNDYLHNTNDYIYLSMTDPWYYINKGFMVFFSYKSSSGSGHVEIGLPYNTPTISSEYAPLNTSDERFTVGAGATMGAKRYDLSPINFDEFLYLGFLKRSK